MEYYPAQRPALDLTVIRREYTLPQGAIGSVEAREGQRVDLRDVVARGTVPAHHYILEAAKFFNLRRPEQLEALLLVDPGVTVEAGQPLAGKSADRGKRLFSPTTGIVSYIGEGRIVVQEMPALIDLQPGVIGTVVNVQEGRGVQVETVGALLQGVWGNGRRVIGALRIEPEEGLETIYSDEFNMQYRGTIVLTKRPLKQTGLLIAADQGLLGIIAPSMDASLRDEALAHSAAVMLTVGFGEYRLSTSIVNLIETLEGRQGTLDAATPDRQDTRRPELIVNIAVRQNERPAALNPNIALQKGLTVRVTRDPHAGLVGRVTDLPKTPTMLDNGLRVPCAKVELLTGETVFVPVANLELFGK
jgi:hypothetical protein